MIVSDKYFINKVNLELASYQGIEDKIIEMQEGFCQSPAFLIVTNIWYHFGSSSIIIEVPLVIGGLKLKYKDYKKLICKKHEELSQIKSDYELGQIISSTLLVQAIVDLETYQALDNDSKAVLADKDGQDMAAILMRKLI